MDAAVGVDENVTGMRIGVNTPSTNIIWQEASEDSLGEAVRSMPCSPSHCASVTLAPAISSS